MISIGPFLAEWLQGGGRGIPKEVMDWLLPRSKTYPSVTFTVDRIVPSSSPIPVDQYACFFTETAIGITSVSFLYGSEQWNIRFIGMLTKQQRKELVDLPEGHESIQMDNGAFLLAVRRSEGSAMIDRPTEFFPLAAE